MTSMRKVRPYYSNCAGSSGDKLLYKYAPLVFLFLFVYLPYSWAQEQHPENVLFVGNSYIYFWNLPQQISEMAKSQNMELETAQSTSGGTNWGQHWRGENGIQSQQLIKSGSYDAIVLQNHSMRSLEAPDSLIYYGKLLANLVKEQDARLYLYMTWAREWDPYMQATIAEAYTRLAKETGATVVPVGLAWQRARERRPDIALYADDGSHPSPLGSYLTACVFYKVFTGAVLPGLPERLLSEDIKGEKLYLNIQSKQNALFLQKVAEEVVNEFTASTRN